jgi:hypothetical protein
LNLIIVYTFYEKKHVQVFSIYAFSPSLLSIYSSGLNIVHFEQVFYTTPNG